MMNEFNDIQQIWNEQSQQPIIANSNIIIQKANEQITKFKRKYIGSMIILSITSIGLIAYWYAFSKNTPAVFWVGLSLMIISLIVRILVELRSLQKFNKVDILTNNLSFTKELLQYYSFRKNILFKLTPIIIGLYTFGFILLLPTFKQIFSTAFFNYILVSGFGFLSFITWIIFKQAKQEVKFLNSLKDIQF